MIAGEVWKSSQKESAGRSAVRWIAWLGLLVQNVPGAFLSDRNNIVLHEVQASAGPKEPSALFVGAHIPLDRAAPTTAIVINGRIHWPATRKLKMASIAEVNREDAVKRENVT
ncbi:MAG: hypothetical protein M3552_01875 [Planctomycetota bacterium]|nr:hypothetical protein [Planctomycetota bacterium]